MWKKWIRGVFSDTSMTDDYPKESDRDVLFGAELGIAAYQISNGFILKIYEPSSTRISARVTLTFCSNEKEIAEQILIQSAKRRIAGDHEKAVTYYTPTTHVNPNTTPYLGV